MSTIRNKLSTAVIGTALLSLALTACGGSGPGAAAGSADEAIDTSSATGEVSYWLWDTNQLPAYTACADAFHAKNRAVTIKISQYGYGDYWGNLTNGFVGGTAPDVFTNHLSKYPELVNQEQLTPLDATLEKDGFDTGVYQEGLADLWVGQDGSRYGLPKDFDTVALFYNKELIKDAGIDEASLQDLTWNPDDGGTYEKAIAHLTVDQNGRRGDEPGFDKTKVKIYGLGNDGSGGANGQTQWSQYTATLPWQVTDKNPWGTHYNFDSLDFQKTIGWMAGLISKGYMPSLAATTGQNASDLYGAGQYAMLPAGDWVLRQMISYKGIETGLAPTPMGPTGARASMYNGLADSIWAGSKNKPAAAKWVEFLGSAECQDIVASSAVVFPAIKSSTEKAIAAFKAEGVDVGPFTDHVTDKTTFLFPITDHASQIEGIMTPAMDAVFSGKAQPSSLTEANNQVNALLGG